MKENILSLIKDSCSNNNKFKILEDIYSLYDQLQYAADLKEMADFIYDWLKIRYKINNVNFALFDIEKNSNESIYTQGKEFYIDDELSFFFIINTHTDLNAIVSFSANSQEHYNKINQNYDNIQAAFFQISPIIQNGIIKKMHIEASSYDSVTKVYNRKYLTEQLNRLIKISGKDNGSIAFLMVGVDHFKAVIDEFDYDTGDKVLIELAKSIHSNIKEFDIVARLTDNEFLVILVDINNIENAVNTAQKIIKKFAECEIDVGTHALKKTICIGISMFPQDSNDFNQVIKNADLFLYEAKNKGRGQFAIYKKEQESSIELF